ncbi:PE-PPE domain-containing protein [Mycobacterium intermedium]|uniref:PE-PPE domain-containing protein n=1 Tax=Mycobacterium intermedium TaxID=28445 RepID=A0A1E3SL21_MYCIE|nr:PE-PPE domain-containing protein [Mycobacterium intermedium]MCV6962562.1 PE-PPE domain-containing protein [Mycobacterium intermedium]ODR02333.1 PE-PPE domain-containing protein [Mycobacterium intermedium]OPE52835.1 PE-PPE domain-containing protein [Mycobacterium intermedium]ORA97164.1 PE-PPE domain-containing protein [Mycobacterium intermedium]
MASLSRSLASIALLLTIGGNVAAVTPTVAHAADEAVPATVFTLDPAFRRLPTNWLRGELFWPPNTTVRVPYANLPAAINVHRGADTLDQYLHATAGPKIVLGHSEGAQVIDDWLRRFGPGSDIDPATVTFVLTGDPESKYNGCMSIPNSGCTAAYGGKGFPIDTRYTVKVISRQYDFWADCPNDLSNSTARMNRFAAMWVGGGGQYRQVHGDYSNIGLNDPSNKTYVEGNATYILGSPVTYYLPMVTLNLTTSDASKRIADMQLRPSVEAAYRRPMEAPPPPY